MSANEKTSDVRDLYMQAVRINDDAARQDFLKNACGSETELRKRVEKLLKLEENLCGDLLEQAVCDENSFAETNLSNPEAMGISEADDEPIRALIDVSQHPMIGHYKLLEELGHGGMGTVYMAQQSQPVKRKVALKVIKPGMGSKEVIARFEAERQALALMDHPNIAKVLDGGTIGESKLTAGGKSAASSPASSGAGLGAKGQGLPYFVMELVRGVPITEFCKHKNLPLRERLELFIDICKAVQHAHQKGIIHRDLKPSNVMITLRDGVPVVKVIDFGVAKALNQELTERTLYTQYSQMVGTPLYMAPEQAEMSCLDIDTRSDIYSLGVVLYELLTGTTPFDKETMSSLGIDGIRKLIKEQEPQRPSARLSTMKVNNVPTIDDQRTLDAEEIAKQLKREIDWIVMKALEKDRERRYESANAFAADVQKYLNDEPVEACPPTLSYRLKKYARKHKASITTVSVVVVALLCGTGIATWQAIRASEAEEVAEGRLKKVDEQKRRAEENLEAAMTAVDRLLQNVSDADLYEIPGMQLHSKKLIEDALKFYETFSEDARSAPRIRLRASSVWRRLGEISFEMGGAPKSIALLKKSKQILEQLVASEPGNDDYQLCLAETLTSLASVTGSFGNSNRYQDKKVLAESERLFIHAAEIYEELSRKHPEDKELSASQATVLLELGVSRKLLGNLNGATEAYQRAYGLAELSGDADVRIKVYHRIALQYQSQRAWDRADDYFRRAIAVGRKRYSESSARVQREEYATMLHEIADNMKSRHPEEVIPYWAEALDIRHSLAKEYPHIRYSAPRAGNTVTHFARHLVALGKHDEARKILGQVAFDPGASWHLKLRARTQFELGNYDEALIDLRKASEWEPNDPSPVVAIRPELIAKCSIESFRTGILDLANQFVEHDPQSANARVARAAVLAELQMFDDALDDLVVLSSREDVGYYQFYQGAVLSAHLGETTHYKSLCQRMLNAFVESPKNSETHFTAWTCALAPDALNDYEPAIKLARRSVERDSDNQQYLDGLGAILLRAGKYEEAKEQLEKALQAGEDGNTSTSYIHYFLAMTEHHLGNAVAAKEHLTKANESADKELDDSPAWNRKLTLELLRKEAEALINTEEQANTKEDDNSNNK